MVVALGLNWLCGQRIIDNGSELNNSLNAHCICCHVDGQAPNIILAPAFRVGMGTATKTTGVSTYVYYPNSLLLAG